MIGQAYHGNDEQGMKDIVRSFSLHVILAKARIHRER
jgi:hypothetical protein